MEVQLVILFFLVAFVYSSIGFGGGSSYLAILSLFSVEYQMLRIIALACNVTVVGGAFYWYLKHDLYRFKKVLPIVFFSVPLAFIGGKMQLTEVVFFNLLGSVLILAGVIMVVQTFITTFDSNKAKKHSQKLVFNGAVGALVGYLSGLVGIGGGIFLSPILHFQKWDKALVIAATSSFFILVNSISGILGNLISNRVYVDWSLLLSLILAVLIGGQVGTRISIKYLNEIVIKRLTAILIIFIGIRILIKY